ncbi:hypothetical protein RRG08_002762 [Elysia crispata]|uniref:Uncharacterized protein n=1 Tax=Elysia crispata TaxID=231223 RepID=A0AAE0XVA2_9GAST|nr:hypothetical protein RRG08_002762 [Elysia crispata]
MVSVTRYHSEIGKRVQYHGECYQISLRDERESNTMSAANPLYQCDITCQSATIPLYQCDITRQSATTPLDHCGITRLSVITPLYECVITRQSATTPLYECVIIPTVSMRYNPSRVLPTHCINAYL